MQLITLCFVFVLSLCTFNVVKCQDCSRENFISQFSAEKLDLSKLENTDSGKTVRLSCTVGYVGLSRYTCKNGEWKKQSGRPCERKSCGHPGDTPNGDFHLTFSDDFVFGAQVEYQCKTGYQMVSRTKHRTCMEQGWDNAIPICEAVKCPVIQANKNVLVIGDSEDATFGNVIQFECQSNQMVLKGPTEIDCNDRGDWSGTVPTCEEIKCYVPNIVHGFVTGSQEEFKENDILRYGCSKYYTPFSRSSRCTKIGNKATWSPPPECEEVKCRLLQKEGTLYKPSGRSVFYPDDKLEIKCPKGFWDFFSKTTEKEVTCNDDGKWSSSTDCEQITCAPPDDTLVKYGRWDRRWRTGRFEEKKDYQCRFGYKPTNGATFAECTNDGTWTPNPLCEEITCAAPDDNRVMQTSLTRWRTGKLNDQNDYQCKPGYKPTKDATFAKCTIDGTWTPTPLCEELCPPLTNGFIVRENASSSTFYYSCNENFKPSTGGWWGMATCKDKKLSGDPTCTINCQIPDIPNSKAVSQNDMKVTCKDGYTLVGTNTIKCTNGELETPLPECKLTCGPPPKVDNAIVKIPYQKIFMEDSRVNYECRNAFVMDGSHEITCMNRIWTTPPTCKQYCGTPDGTGKKMQFSDQGEKRYKEGHEIAYQCLHPHNYKGSVGTGICMNGQWNKTVECIERCPDPPTIENGEAEKSEEKDGIATVVSYKCQTSYTLTFSKVIKCVNGEWESPPECKRK
uniref:Sushi domain-containing protein n=1 Tax=Esox lucius TaxID=8010 RepID=A0A3P8ZD22_ESOLU